MKVAVLVALLSGCAGVQALGGAYRIPEPVPMTGTLPCEHFGPPLLDAVLAAGFFTASGYGLAQNIREDGNSNLYGAMFGVGLTFGLVEVLSSVIGFKLHGKCLEAGEQARAGRS